MKIAAFDLGTKCGWAIQLESGAWTYGHLELKTGRYSGGGARYVLFNTELVQLIGLDAGGPDLVVFEEVRRHLGVDAAHVYGGLLAVLTAFCERHSIPYQGVPVATIKKHATGKGNASKGQMVSAARGQLMLQRQGPISLTEDEADAICLLDYAVSTYKKT